ncbi:MAG TPA: MFS transporter [Thermoleophilaceae bacterium]|nr:MFS transporter [Thermoleophilaceae bacterium]
MSARSSLLRNRPFVALCAARAVSATGDQIAAVALVLLIAKNHPATAVGGLLLAESLPMLLSTHAGVIADRFERRRLMIGCQLGQAVIFAVVTVWLPPYAALLALLVVASLLGTLLRSTTQVVVHATVPDDQLQPANALLGVALWGSMMLGPAIGGALAGIAGPRAALAVDTATFLVSAATLLVLPLLPRLVGDESDTGGVAAALRYAGRDPILRSLILSMTMLVAFAGVDNVAMVFLVRDTLGGGAAAYGAAMAVFGVGMVTGSALVVRYVNWRAERILLGSFTLTAGSATMLALAPSLASVYPAQLIGGMGNGLDIAAQTTLVQRRTPPSMLGRMSGAANSGVAVGFLVAYLGGGALVDVTSPRTAFLVAAAGSLLAIVVARPVWRSVATAST